jgi:hypothetical protein
LKLEKNKSEKDFENALKFLKLRSEKCDKEVALLLAKKMSCKEEENKLVLTRKDGLLSLL